MDRRGSRAYGWPMSVENQIIDLEIRIAYQDKLIASLDEVIQGFSDRMQKLERQMEALREGASVQSGPANDPPPHY